MGILLLLGGCAQPAPEAKASFAAELSAVTLTDVVGGRPVATLRAQRLVASGDRQRVTVEGAELSTPAGNALSARRGEYDATRHRVTLSGGVRGRWNFGAPFPVKGR